MKTVRLLWLVAFQWQHMLETSGRFIDLLIPFYPTVYGMLEWVWKGQLYEARHNALQFRGIFQAVRISQFVHIWNFSSTSSDGFHHVFFPGWKTHVKWVARRWSQVQRGSRNQPKWSWRKTIEILASREHLHGGFGFSLFLCGLTLRPLNKLRKSDWNWVGPVGPPIQHVPGR